jgi:putative phosphoribosyl transferase
MIRFRDRRDAGRHLARAVAQVVESGPTPEPGKVVVLGLPRGGVPVAFEIAVAIGAPLDVFVVRKLGVPGHPELAMGAIAPGGIEVLSQNLVAELGITPAEVAEVAARERRELERRERLFRDDRPPIDLSGRTAIVVDDGLATGSTMEAAVAALRALGPASIIVAVPVGARESCQRLKQSADRIVCLETPVPFNAVGEWYDDFVQTTDEEVRQLLAATPRVAAPTTGSGRPEREPPR